MTTIVVIMWLW